MNYEKAGGESCVGATVGLAEALLSCPKLKIFKCDNATRVELSCSKIMNDEKAGGESYSTVAVD
jgi:hypothetical protein